MPLRNSSLSQTSKTPERRRSRAHSRLLGIAELVGFEQPNDAAAHHLRREQIREMTGTAPVTLTASGALTLLFFVQLSRQQAVHGAGWWFAAMVGLLLFRMLRLASLKRRLERDASWTRGLGEITATFAVQALLWIVPIYCWFKLANESTRIFMTLVVIGTMARGSVALAVVPLAAILFVLITGLALVGITILTGSATMTALALMFGLLLMASIMKSARRFARDVGARAELEEQGQLIKLLREFQTSGSDWLWELDADCRIKQMSQGMADALGLPLDQLLGRSLHELIDPRGEYRLLADGIRALFDHLERGTAFNELAFPTVDGCRWYCLSGRPIVDANGRVAGWHGVGSDITAIRSGPGTEGQRLARRDPLTGLANRFMVREMIEEARLCQIRGKGACVLLVCDLDRFKLVNDALGHAAGDRLLADVAGRLAHVCGPDGGVGRLGGDEFAVVWRGESDTTTLLDLSERIAEAVGHPFTMGPSMIHVGISIGIARAPVDGGSNDRLMRSADLALYRSKEEGRGGCSFYEPWMLSKAQAERLLESDVREAVRLGDLHLHYQPIVDASSFDVVGFEALLRWWHPTRGAVRPEVFVPIIEDVGLIHQIGDWVIREACAEAARWPTRHRVAVNISVAQLTGSGLKCAVAEGLAASGLDPDRLELEVTENVFLGDDSATLSALSSLQSLGVRLVLDDFGKGYSSFGYLSRARFSKIKIDQLFVRGAANGRRESLAIVDSILALARGLGVETTAEGIETVAQAELLAHLGCTQLQGFLFGKPAPTAQVEDASSAANRLLVVPAKRRA